jgi:GT2 family glycosyltransferase
MIRVAILMTCHNRRDTTLRCIREVLESTASAPLRLSVVLVDDASSDGTPEEVARSFPSVVIEHGDGSLFWNRGMHRAQQAAVQSDPDFLLWLNDDTIVVPRALSTLLATYEKLKAMHGCEVVVVGATADGESGQLTYGGLVAASRLRKFNFRKLPIASEPRECGAMNGNIVLVPRAIYQSVGSLDPVFEHAMGDIDYALRVREAGFRVFVAPGIQGYCSANKVTGTHLDSKLSMRERWLKFKGRKGLPFASWRHFVRQHAGWGWPVYFAWPYINFALRLIREAAVGHITQSHA